MIDAIGQSRAHAAALLVMLHLIACKGSCSRVPSLGSVKLHPSRHTWHAAAVVSTAVSCVGAAAAAGSTILISTATGALHRAAASRTPYGGVVTPHLRAADVLQDNSV